MNRTRMLEALAEVCQERERQEELKRAGKFPWSCADAVDPDDGYHISDAEKLAVLAEEFGEVADVVCKLQAKRAEAATVSRAKLREELIQVAAVAVAWVEAIDRE